ncbi:MAG: hypothetical protein HPPSJP_3100 [Candidatus Hepatoplasma scabrum]|nr:MAG: hypothetical protein HPPSJP_3100 [Candidatus Hepatoplasma sp.]
MKTTKNNQNDDKLKKKNSSFLLSFFIDYFKPSTYVNSVLDIDLKELQNQGVKLIICDLDNTLVPHFRKFPTNSSFKFLKNVKKMKFEFVIISNNTEKRVKFFAEKLGVKEDYIANARKPFPKKTKRYLEDKFKGKYKNSEIVIIGDMLITDIFIANILRINSILVSPLLEPEKFMNKILSFIEKKVFKRLSRENLITSKPIYQNNDDLDKYELL